jgi:hypothetical protein
MEQDYADALAEIKRREYNRPIVKDSGKIRLAFCL